MRLVVKVGTSTLTHSTGLLNIRRVERLCKTLADIENSGHQVILVSSGAIGMGVGKLNLDKKPTDMATKQAAAAVGQCELMYIYDKMFGEYNHTVAQILLTGNDVDNEVHRENIRSTINRLLELGVIPIINENDSVATSEIDEVNALGDNDTLAAIVSVCIQADMLILMSDIDGLYTADPRKVPTARKLKEITYDEMLDLATLGAGVLHNRSVEMAKKYGVPLVVRSSLNDSEGTVVKEVVSVERMLISGVALDTDAVRIAVLGLRDVPGMAFKLFDTLAKKNINVDVILQSIGRAGTKDISFTVDGADLDDAVAVLEANQARLGYKELHAERNIAKLSIVGAGMMSNPGVAAKMFESLYNEGVNINMISTSEIRVTVLINEKDGVRAMNAVHDAFNLAD